MGKNNKEEYQLNQLVMAQVRGYPWWPGYIGGRQADGSYKVVFFGDFSYAPLNEKKIRTFDPRMKKLEKNRKELQRALKSATRVFKGETTIKQEFDIVNKKKLPPLIVAKPSVTDAKKPAKKVARPKKKKTLKKKPLQNKSKTSRDAKKRRRGRAKKKATQKLKVKRELEIVNMPKEEPQNNLREQKAEQVLNRSGFWGGESDEGKASSDMKIGFQRKTVGMDGFRSVTAKGPEPNLFDSMAETNSMRLMVESLKHNQQNENSSRAGSEIAILDQTKGSLGSIEKMKNLIVASGKLAFNGPTLEALNKSPSISRKDTLKIGEAQSEVSENTQFRLCFKEIEQEMISLIKKMRENQSTEAIENKLKSWFREMAEVQDFSSIVGTKIGQYLMQMKFLCHEKIKERQQYGAILQEIKNFKRIIITKISQNFFSSDIQEDQSGLESLVDRLPSQHNQSPMSKDKTMLQIFGKQMMGSFGNLNFSHAQSPNLNKTLLRNTQSYEHSFMLPTTRPSRVRNKHNRNRCNDLDETFNCRRKGTDLNITMKGSKMNQQQILETPSISTVVNKSQRKTMRPIQIIKPAPWNWKNNIEKKVMRCVGKKIARALYRNKGEHCLSAEKAEQLGRICEEIVGKDVSSCMEYQRRVMDLLANINQRGSAFLRDFIFQKKGTCSVIELGKRLRSILKLGN